MTHPPASNLQTVVACGVMLVGLAMAGGAVSIPSAAGYGGVGPNFLPWLVSIALIVCGAFMVWESRTGGFRAMGEADHALAAFAPWERPTARIGFGPVGQVSHGYQRACW